MDCFVRRDTIHYVSQCSIHRVSLKSSAVLGACGVRLRTTMAVEEPDIMLLEHVAQNSEPLRVSTRVLSLKTHKAVGTHGGKAQKHHDSLATWHKDQTVRLLGHES